MTMHANLRALIARIGVSQAMAARLIGISPRQMRSYLADPALASTAIEAPDYVGLALEGIIARLREIEIPDDLMDAVADGARVAIWPGGRWQYWESGQVPADDDPPLHIEPAGDATDGWMAEDRNALRARIEAAVFDALDRNN